MTVWKIILTVFFRSTVIGTRAATTGESTVEEVIQITIIIVIIITRPRPAFGRLGLGRSSGGKTLGGVSTPRFAPSALSSALKQYILALSSRSSLS